MERMSHTNNYESRLWRLLEAEKLSDLSQFHQRGFFEEVPLIAREADIDFLPQGKDRARQILVRFALKFLKSVIAYEEHRKKQQYLRPSGGGTAAARAAQAGAPLVSGPRPVKRRRRT